MFVYGIKWPLAIARFIVFFVSIVIFFNCIDYIKLPIFDKIVVIYSSFAPLKWCKAP